MDSKEKLITKQPHHERKQLCTSRPPYRQGNKLTAVKVYTVSDESQHLIIRGVPSLNLLKELKNLCMRYGEVKQIHQVKDYAHDEEFFTEVFHVTFARIQSARFAKHMVDDKSFFGGILHVCYAPELETISETRHKLDQRRHEVLKRLSQYAAADLKKSQKMSQCITEPIPGPSGINVSSVSTAYTLQNRFSSPNSTLHRFKKPVNHHSVRKKNSTSSTSSTSIQATLNQPSQILIGPQMLAEVGTKVDEVSPASLPFRDELNPNCSSSKLVDVSAKSDHQKTTKRTKFTILSKFIPPQVKRIKFN